MRISKGLNTVNPVQYLDLLGLLIATSVKIVYNSLIITVSGQALVQEEEITVTFYGLFFPLYFSR